MQLTRHSDYSVRVLIFLATARGDLSTIPQIARAYRISRAHLMKVVQTLAELGYVETLRGRGGGIRLAMEPSKIRLGEVLRRTEESFKLVDCFSEAGCRIQSACKLKGALQEALNAFLGTLDGYTLADVVEGQEAPLRRLLRVV